MHAITEPFSVVLALLRVLILAPALLCGGTHTLHAIRAAGVLDGAISRGGADSSLGPRVR
jgi:hypothetical protein